MSTRPERDEHERDLWRIPDLDRIKGKQQIQQARALLVGRVSGEQCLDEKAGS